MHQRHLTTPDEPLRAAHPLGLRPSGESGRSWGAQYQSPDITRDLTHPGLSTLGEELGGC